MNSANAVIARLPATQSVATATNGAATVTLAAPGTAHRWAILSHTISMSGDPATTVEFTIVAGGSTTLETMQIPAAACAPICSSAIYLGGRNEAVVLNLPALGSGIKGTVSVRAVKIGANATV